MSSEKELTEWEQSAPLVERRLDSLCPRVLIEHFQLQTDCEWYPVR